MCMHMHTCTCCASRNTCAAYLCLPQYIRTCTCCLQADLNGHWYNYGARVGVNHIIDYSKILEVGYGYVVESRKEVELPEA